MGYLIDTSVIVAWERGKLAAEEVAAQAGEEEVALSAITASELLHGVHRANTALRRGKRQAFVEAILDAVPILPVDLAVGRVHARVWADMRARGEVIGAHDLLIAATALAHRLTIATRNARDFARVEGLPVSIW